MEESLRLVLSLHVTRNGVNKGPHTRTSLIDRRKEPQRGEEGEYVVMATSAPCFPSME